MPFDYRPVAPFSTPRGRYGDAWGVTLDDADLPPFLPEGYRPGFSGANSTPGTMLQTYQLIDYRGLKTRSGKDVVDTFVTRYCQRGYDRILVGREDYYSIAEQVAWIRFLQSYGLGVDLWLTGSGDEAGGGRAGWARAKEIMLPLLSALFAAGPDCCDKLTVCLMQEASRGASPAQVREIYQQACPLLAAHGIPAAIHHIPNYNGFPEGSEVDAVGEHQACANEWGRLRDAGLKEAWWQADPWADTGSMGGRAYEFRRDLHAGVGRDVDSWAYELHGERQLYQGGPQSYPELHLGDPDLSRDPRTTPADPIYFTEEMGCRQSREIMNCDVEPGSDIPPWTGTMSGDRWPDGRPVYHGVNNLPLS